MTSDYIKDYYEQYNEDGRLENSHGQVEYLTTMHYIKQYAKKEGRILEVGAGTGRYSISLAGMGYKVTAVELIKHNLEQLQAKITKAHQIEAYEGNALDLSRFDDDTFELTLVLGPLYHLYSEADCQRAIKEALRVTKPGGKVMIAYLSHDSVIMKWGFIQNNILKGIEDQIVTDDFTCVSREELLFRMFHVDDFRALMDEAGSLELHMIGTDGLAPMIPGMMDEMDDRTFEAFMAYQMKVCERKDLIGYSSHLLYVGEKA